MSTLLDCCKHLVKSRQHNNLNQSFRAPFENCTRLQLVRDRLPRHRLCQDRVQKRIRVL